MLPFVAIAAVLVVTPGADTILVLRTVVAHGTRAGFSTVAGIGAGCVVHAVLSAAGLSAILVQSSRAFDILKIAGAAYLMVLGAHGLWTAAHSNAPDAGDEWLGARAPSSRAFRDGFLTNVLNPKVAIFYLAFLPQFIDGQRGLIGAYALLAGIHIAMGVVWLSALTLALDRIRPWVSSRRVRRGLDALAGTALLGLGVRLAVAKR